jgi:predicted DNA-binding protein YlxM (UPF0122 family)
MRKISSILSHAIFNEKSEHRQVIDLLRSRLNLLSGKDKLLMTMHLERGNSFRQMARLAGVNETIIARRIHKLMKRLLDSEYITCLRNHNKFNSIELSIAKEYFLTGLSMREIAVKQHLTYYRVRKILKKIQQITATIRQQESGPMHGSLKPVLSEAEGRSLEMACYGGRRTTDEVIKNRQ